MPVARAGQGAGAGRVLAMAATSSAASVEPSSKRVLAPPTESEISVEVYIGVVKSYNDRRGFGFLACSETAERYGRDVYMPKAEAAQAALEAAIANGESVPPLPVAPLPEGEKPPPQPRLAEEDLVGFRVRLSVEGYPQAAEVKKFKKLWGVVVRVPTDESLGAIASAEAKELYRIEEVLVRRVACGQIRLVVGDEVQFCVTLDYGEEGSGVASGGGAAEAKLVSLANTSRPAGSVLGCFSLDLPRTGGGEGAPTRPNLSLHCHAFGDKLILAGLPADLEEAELMRFFSKQGASGTIVAHARACSFASVTFPSITEVARFLSRVFHAFPDEKETALARLIPLIPSRSTALLPALPAPSLGQAEEANSLLVVWSPLVLAVAYKVELRPSGTEGSWTAVESGNDSADGGNTRFDVNCSSCKVAGLQLGASYEARVSYFTECGTMSEASEASPICIVGASPPLLGTNSGLGAAEGFGQQPGWGPPPMAPVDMSGFAPNPYMPPPMAGYDFAGAGLPPLGFEGMPPLYDSYAPPLPGPMSWRSPTGLVVPPPAAPEVLAADEFGFAVSVQWPAVLQASAYVVELREVGSAACERFVRSAPEAKLGTLVELRVGGLKPGPPPGRVYVAQVRTVAPDGSESEPSPPGISGPLPSLPSSGPDAAANALGSGLSADAAPWFPGAPLDASSQDAKMTQSMEAAPMSQAPAANVTNWAPPPWLGQLQPVGSGLGALGSGVQVGGGDAAPLVQGMSYAPIGPPTRPPLETPNLSGVAAAAASSDTPVATWDGTNNANGPPPPQGDQDACLILD